MLAKVLPPIIVASCVYMATAAAVKVKALTPVNGENAQADGMAILNYHPGPSGGVGNTEVQVSITDFSPGTYAVFTADADGDTTDSFGLDAIVTNPNGSGSTHTSPPAHVDQTTAPVQVVVYIDQGEPGFAFTDLNCNGRFELGEPTDDAVRAIGQSQ